MADAPMVEEQAAVLAAVARSELSWHQVAALVEATGSARRLVAGDATGLDPFEFDQAQVRHLAEQVDDTLLASYRSLIGELAGRGVRLVTVLDRDYPANLRQVYDRPPFLFVRGALEPDDQRAVAVVGTRNASEAGLEAARQLAGGLAERGVTVLSGLARGIDGAAHSAALDADGRTVAVLGTGIDRTYPPEHEGLARRVSRHGALVSQFWPAAPPTRTSFLIRNVVTSGMALGTVVVEAHGRSGARNQARRCLEHGKRLFLLGSLVMREPWAQTYARHPGTTVVDDAAGVLAVLDQMAAVSQQLRLG